MGRPGILGVFGILALNGAPLAAQAVNLQATATGPTTVELSWNQVATATGYIVQRGLGAAALQRLTPTKLSDTKYTDAAAPAGTALRYRIRAVLPSGQSAMSGIVSVTTPSVPAGPVAMTPSGQPSSTQPLGQPTAEIATPGSGTATLRPEAGAIATSPDPSGVRLRGGAAISGSPTAPTAAPAPSATAPANVVAVNPSAFLAKQIGDGKVQLSWRSVDDPAPSYYVLLGPGVPDGAVRLPRDTTFTVTGVPPGTHEWAVASYYEPGPVTTPAAEFPRARATLDVMALTGWVDLHTHPMVNLAFGGKLVEGGVDEGSLLPQDASCQGQTRASSIGQALGDDRPTHGGHDFLHFTCGDDFRQMLHVKFQEGNRALVTGFAAKGYPDFNEWPKWNDVTHQKMWYEWIRRARDGGLRVLVALATNNKTLADAVQGPGDVIPTSDKASADLQLSELKSFVGRHSDFMEVALGADDVKRIVQSNRIAVVLGVEIDNIGDFNRLPPNLLFGPNGELTGTGEQIISGEIQRLYNEGVRYVLPIHVMDNVFGGTAIYQDGFNRSNLREAGHFWDIECAQADDDITFKYDEHYDLIEAIGAMVKLNLDPLRRSGPGPECTKGHRNVRGLTLQGIYAIKQMMKRGMIVDIDHMSHHGVEKALEIAEQYDYPIVSGHSGIRGHAGANAENSRTRHQLERISKLHGMFGLGTDGVSRSAWANQYQYAMNIMGYPNGDPNRSIYRPGAIAFGSDLDGLVKGPAPGWGNSDSLYKRPNYSFPKSMSGSKTWDFTTDGVAHYGMMWDFVMDLRRNSANTSTGANGVPTGVSGGELVDNHLSRSANYFWQMWSIIDARKGNVQ